MLNVPEHKASGRAGSSPFPTVHDFSKDAGSAAGTPIVDHLRALAVFASVVNTGTFRGAARELGLAPSVVSHHVSSLERRLRVVLLFRSTRKLSLTPEGKRLFEVTSAVLSSTEAAFNEISRKGEDPSGTIRISAPAAAGSGPLIEHFATFMRMYPRVRMLMHLTEYCPDQRRDDYDLILRICWPGQSTKRMKKLYSVPGRLVASPAYLSSKSTPEHPSDLATWDWIYFEPRPRELEFTHPKLGVVNLIGVERASVDSITALHRLARSDIGITRLPEFLANPSIASGELVEVLPQWKLASPGIYAVLPPNLPKTGILWKLVQFLRVQTAEMPLTT